MVYFKFAIYFSALNDDQIEVSKSHKTQTLTEILIK